MVRCVDIPNSGYTETPAIEVCTIESAKQLGIYSTSGDFYASGYTDLKTYNNAADVGRTKDVCYQSADGANSYMFCSAAHSNIAYVKRGDKCQTMTCPTGWSGVQKCQKPLEDAVVSKRSHCDERWYDWFTVPNYHLGNKYQSDSNIAGTCYNPCPADHVPHYKYDPVDESTFGLSGKEALGRCVPRNQYFGGKYNEGSDYCPLAWVYRMGASPDVLKDMMTSNMTTYATSASVSGTSNADFMTLQDPSTMQNLANSIYNNTSATAENVVAPSTRSMQQACRTLQTKERVEGAYAICSSIATLEGENEFLSKRELQGDSTDIAEAKLKVLKQACNATFCDADNDAAYVIKKEPLCFKTESITEGKFATEPDKKENVNVDGMKFVMRALQIFWGIIIMACVIGLVVVFYRYGKPWIVSIMRFIMRVPQRISRVKDQLDQELSTYQKQIQDLQAKNGM